MKNSAVISLFVVSSIFISDCKLFNEKKDNDEITAAHLELLWKKYTVGSTSVYPPAFSEGIVYTIVGRDGIHAYRASNGELVWKNDYVPDSLGMELSRITLDEEQVYVPLSAWLHCYNKNTGEFKYKVFCGSRGALVDEEKIYVADGGGYEHLYAYDKYTGEEVWRTQRLKGRIWDIPSIDGEYIYAGLRATPVDSSGWVAKINRSNGSIVYRVQTRLENEERWNHGPSSGPVFYEETFIIDGGSDRVNAYNKHTGELQWYAQYREGSGAINYMLRIENGIVYFATQDTWLVAVNAEDGSILWKTDEIRGSCNLGPVALYKNLLFAESADSYIYCFNKNNGEMIFKMLDYWAPSVHNDTLFVGGYDDPYSLAGKFFAAYLIVED